MRARKKEGERESERKREREGSDTNRSNYYNITIMNDTVLL